MPTILNKKLLKILTCIEGSCNSSVRIFDHKKGHSSRSAGFAAYEERQKKLRDLSDSNPDVIEFLCKKGLHCYFKFEGKTIKIISSPRETLNNNVFDRNTFEINDDEFGSFDPLIRIIYKTDYDLSNNEATLLECHYLEIDRNTHCVLKEVNLLDLSKENNGFLTAVSSEKIEEIELPAGGLIPKAKEKLSNDND